MGGRRREVDSLTDDLGWLIPRARRLVWHHAHARLERRGASMFVWPLMKRIMDHGALSQLELAHLTAQHPTAVCRTLEDLERKGLVRRERDAYDRRRMVVRATPKGRAWCRRLHPAVLAGVDAALRALGPAERATLRGLLRKLLATAEDEPALKGDR